MITDATALPDPDDHKRKNAEKPEVKAGPVIDEKVYQAVFGSPDKPLRLARIEIQNTVRETGRIARCYHLDSLNNDCLQCCDLLLGATRLLRDNPGVRMVFEGLKSQHAAGQKLKDSQVKQILAGYLGKWVDSNAARVYDIA